MDRGRPPKKSFGSKRATKRPVIENENHLGQKPASTVGERGERTTIWSNKHNKRPGKDVRKTQLRGKTRKKNQPPKNLGQEWKKFLASGGKTTREEN